MRVAVVGGGIAGLTAAFELKRLGAEPVVFEGANQVGGKLRLGELADVTIDVGAEAVLARRPEAIELITEVGLAADLVAPVELGPMIWSHGKLRNLPSTVMGIPRDFTEVADIIARALLPDADIAALSARVAAVAAKHPLYEGLTSPGSWA